MCKQQIVNSIWIRSIYGLHIPKCVPNLQFSVLKRMKSLLCLWKLIVIILHIFNPKFSILNLTNKFLDPVFYGKQELMQLTL